jgi:tRNA(fMet)-specific endonuclease VapC
VAIRERLRTTRVADIAVCSVVKAELFYGAMRSNNPEQSLARQQQFLNLFVSLPFDDAAALIYGHIRADLAVSGTPIGPNDLQIASIARANSLILVTHNTGEFSRVDGLQIEDWEEVP